MSKHPTTNDDFSDYVPHPRYGQGPRLTGLDLSDKELGDGRLRSRYPTRARVPNTAIKADVLRQRSWCTSPYYFDVKRTCEDCERSFLFFAEEQRFWYEVLQFSLDADALRCVPCRKVAQDTSRLIELYQELVNLERDPQQQLAFAEVTMTLLERRAFGLGPLDQLRGAIKRLPDGKRQTDLRARLKALLERDAPAETPVRPIDKSDKSDDPS